MKLSQLGERKVIEYIRKRFGQRSQHLTGIGDDTAILGPSTLFAPGPKDLLLTTDVLVEGVDFDLRYCPFHQVGFKAMAANLSDIAAMGGMPRFYLVALGLRRNMELSQVDELYQGMADSAHDYKVGLIGGDISSTRREMFVGIMILGEVGKGRAIVRSGARAGDLIFVTGTLGDAAAGLELIRDRSMGHFKKLSRLHQRSMLPLVQKQFYPVPRIEEGRLFSTRRIASAMIDVSDGLASDLRHICVESRVGAVVETESLPLSDALVEYAGKVRVDPLIYALTGGEDFELLFTVPERNIPHLMKLAHRKRLSLTQIGKILPRASGLKLKNARGKRVPFPARGYEHFKTSF
jgi:thiamine-monophosphate kinase